MTFRDYSSVCQFFSITRLKISATDLGQYFLMSKLVQGEHVLTNKDRARLTIHELTYCFGLIALQAFRHVPITPERKVKALMMHMAMTSNMNVKTSNPRRNLVEVMKILKGRFLEMWIKKDSKMNYLQPHKRPPARLPLNKKSVFVELDSILSSTGPKHNKTIKNRNRLSTLMETEEITQKSPSSPDSLYHMIKDVSALALPEGAVGAGEQEKKGEKGEENGEEEGDAKLASAPKRGSIDMTKIVHGADEPKEDEPDEHVFDALDEMILAGFEMHSDAEDNIEDIPSPASKPCSKSLNPVVKEEKIPEDEKGDNLDEKNKAKEDERPGGEELPLDHLSDSSENMYPSLIKRRHTMVVPPDLARDLRSAHNATDEGSSVNPLAFGGLKVEIDSEVEGISRVETMFEPGQRPASGTVEPIVRCETNEDSASGSGKPEGSNGPIIGANKVATDFTFAETMLGSYTPDQKMTQKDRMNFQGMHMRPQSTAESNVSRDIKTATHISDTYMEPREADGIVSYVKDAKTSKSMLESLDNHERRPSGHGTESVGIGQMIVSKKIIHDSRESLGVGMGLASSPPPPMETPKEAPSIPDLDEVPKNKMSRTDGPRITNELKNPGTATEDNKPMSTMSREESENVPRQPMRRAQNLRIEVAEKPDSPPIQSPQNQPNKQDSLVDVVSVKDEPETPNASNGLTDSMQLTRFKSVRFESSVRKPEKRLPREETQDTELDPEEDVKIYRNSAQWEDRIIASVKKGSAFIKYGRRGKPSERILWVSKDNKYLKWGLTKKQPSKKFLLSNFRDCLLGQKTALFKKRIKSEHKSDIHVKRSMSLLLKGKSRASVDLIALTNETIEIWVSFLNMLLNPGKRNIDPAELAKYGRIKYAGV